MSAQTITIEWHRFVDGPPPKSGKYLVAHRAMHKVVYFNPEGQHPHTRKAHAFTERRHPRRGEPGFGDGRGERRMPTEPWGWMESITWASHWAEMPDNFLPQDDAPQLFTEAGTAGYCEAREAQWAARAMSAPDA